MSALKYKLDMSAKIEVDEKVEVKKMEDNKIEKSSIDDTINSIIDKLVTRELKQKEQKKLLLNLVKVNVDTVLDQHEKEVSACIATPQPKQKQKSNGGYYNNIEKRREAALARYYKKKSQMLNTGSENAVDELDVEKQRENYYKSKGEEEYKLYILKRDNPSEYEAYCEQKAKDEHYKRLYAAAAAKGDEYLKRWLMKRSDPSAYKNLLKELSRQKYSKARYDYHASLGEEHLQEWLLKNEHPEEYRIYKTAKSSTAVNPRKLQKWQIDTAKTLSFAQWLDKYNDPPRPENV